MFFAQGTGQVHEGVGQGDLPVPDEDAQGVGPGKQGGIFQAFPAVAEKLDPQGI